MSYLRWLVRIRRNPSALLLLVQLVGILVYPFLEDTEAGRIAFGTFGIAVLVATTRMVRSTPGLNRIAFGLALPAVLLQLIQAFQPQPWLIALSAGLEAAFYFYAAASLIAYMMADRHATTDELFAAGATFTLIAWAFTWLFILLQALRPGSFAAAVNPEQLRSWTELMYLSFALLSSTGIGDVIPLTPIARAVAAVEMFVGVMYLAAVVSRLIGLTLIQRGGRGAE